MAEIVSIANTSPGVYTREFDLSQFSPTGAIAAIPGVVGVADKGPEGVATLITSKQEYESIFGKPSLQGYGGLAAIRALDETGQLFFTRVATASATKSVGTITSPAAKAQLTGSETANFTFDEDNNRLVLKLNDHPSISIEFEASTLTAAEVALIINGNLTDNAPDEVTVSASGVTGLLTLTSTKSGSTARIEVLDSEAASAHTLLGFSTTAQVGDDSVAASITSTDNDGTFTSGLDSSEYIEVKFDTDTDKVVRLENAAIDGIDNTVDLVAAFNAAANLVSASLGSSSVLIGENFKLISPVFGATSAVEITAISATLSGEIYSSPKTEITGSDATFPTLTNTATEGYDLTGTSLMFTVQNNPASTATVSKTITFSDIGTAAYGTATYSIPTGLVDAGDITVTLGEDSIAFANTVTTVSGAFDEIATAINASAETTISGVISATDDGSEFRVTHFQTNSNGNSTEYVVGFLDGAATSGGITVTPSDGTLGFGKGSKINTIERSLLTETIDEINRQAGGIYATEWLGSVRLTSQFAGALSVVEITSGNAILGYLNEQKDLGEAEEDLLTVNAATTGSWGNNLSIEIVDTTVQVSENGVLKERILNFNTLPGTNDFIREKINNESTLIEVPTDGYTGDVGATIPTGLSTPLADGDSGALVTAADIIAGIRTLSNQEQIPISVIAAPGYSQGSVTAELIRLSEAREDVIALLDPPIASDAEDIVKFSNGELDGSVRFNSSYAALYWPWMRASDEYNAVLRLVPPSVLMVKKYIEVSNRFGDWFAPAGVQRGKLTDAIDIEVNATQAERDSMYSDDPGNVQVVNPIYNILGEGITVWGQKTTQRELSALNRVNVRRLVLFVKKKFIQIANKLVFEPNDPTTWAKFVRRGNEALADVQERRGLNGFSVKMDADLNTPDTIAQGKLFGQVIIKPRLVAEQIIIPFQIVGQDFQI